ACRARGAIRPPREVRHYAEVLQFRPGDRCGSLHASHHALSPAAEAEGMTDPNRPVKGNAMRATIYARFSSDLQREQSIEDQVRVCRQRIDREGWTPVATYCDRASSRASRLRPGHPH